MRETEQWIRLALTLGPRSRFVHPLLAHFKGPSAIFSATESELRAAFPRFTEAQLRALLNQAGEMEAVRIARWCESHGVRVLTMADETYPACLRGIDEPPVLLYCRGELPDLSRNNAVGVVGTRRIDAYGEQATYKLSFAMARAGIVTVSGMAAGADGIAAAATLAAGGAHVAVLGCGIDVLYPRHHDILRDAIAENGALLSEFPPGTEPNARNFPIRNRLISALSEAVLVTEAPSRSGALITARYAKLQGKTLFAVPGDIFSPLCVGCNRLLRDGAVPAIELRDILCRLRGRNETDEDFDLPATVDPTVLDRYGVRAARGKQVTRPRSVETPPPSSAAPTLDMLDAHQREIYTMLPEGPFSLDLFEGKGVTTSELAATLTVFEIYGLVGTMPGGRYRKIIS